MPLPLTTISDLQAYLSGVAQRADHHAQNVNEVILALAGAVVLFKDATSQLRVRTHAGRPANVLWMEIKGQTYALAYNHDGHVEVRLNTTRGRVLRRFDDTTSSSDIIQFFGSLRS